MFFFFSFVIACILSVFHMNLPMFQWILSAKGLLPFHPSTEEGANERTCDSYGDILLVDSCTLPLAVCLEIFTPLLPGYILSLEVYGLRRQLIPNTTRFDFIFGYSLGNDG